MINQELGITNIGTWMMDHDDKVFRFYIYKKAFTPFEQKQCYRDESIYENASYPMIAYITNVIELPGDILLELKEYDEDPDEDYQKQLNDVRYYYKLSEIKMEYHESDQPEIDF